MEWPLALLILFGCLVILMATGMPVAFAFLVTCLTGSILFWGGLAGLEQLVMSIFGSVTTFSILPLPLFILMGNIIFESGVGIKMVDAMDRIMGRFPARLSIVAILGGSLLGTMIGISGGTLAILGRTLVPEMRRRGYKNAMSVGPIVATGALAVLIPPSAFAVFLGAIAEVSVGKLLIAIVPVGVLLAVSFCVYIIVRSVLQPSLAPSYEVSASLKDKLNALVRYILPAGIVIFAAIGSVFVGIATPSEAAALGAIACYLLAAFYRKLGWQAVRKSASSTMDITVMVFMIIVGSISFSQILASSGAVRGLIDLTMSLDMPPLVIIIATLVVLLFLGALVDPASIVMITVPLFIPIVEALGFNTLWYAVLMLLSIQLGLITPPFGLDVYTMKAIAPPDISAGDIFRSAMPFFGIAILVLAFIVAFPEIVLWLPGMMIR
ncbi:MAG: TRAP transporter large permease subunit [Dehalococcoidia bacterium]